MARRSRCIIIICICCASYYTPRPRVIWSAGVRAICVPCSFRYAMTMAGRCVPIRWLCVVKDFNNRFGFALRSMNGKMIISKVYVFKMCYNILSNFRPIKVCPFFFLACYYGFISRFHQISGVFIEWALRFTINIIMRIHYWVI